MACLFREVQFGRFYRFQASKLGSVLVFCLVSDFSWVVLHTEENTLWTHIYRNLRTKV